jgi:hypothetical protein
LRTKELKSATPNDGTAPSTPELAQETVEVGAMLTQADVRGLVRSRFWTGFLSGVATAVCVFWLERLLSTAL